MPRAVGERSPVDQGIFLVHLNRARRSARTGSFDVAWTELEQARTLRPKDEDVLNLLSLLEFKRGRYDEAAPAARALLEKNSVLRGPPLNLGLILFKAGLLGEAEQELRAAIDLAPGHLRSHLYLGLLYQMPRKARPRPRAPACGGSPAPVAEIEESIKRPSRDGGPRSAGLSDTAPTSARPQRRRPRAPDPRTAPSSSRRFRTLPRPCSPRSRRPEARRRPRPPTRGRSSRSAPRAASRSRRAGPCSCGRAAWPGTAARSSSALEPTFRGTSLEKTPPLRRRRDPPRQRPGTRAPSAAS